MRKKRHNFIKFLAAAVLLCALITADSAFRLTVSVYEPDCSGLPDGFSGFRIVQLSDLHGAEFGENNSRLVRRVRELEPDIIALTGDLFGSGEELDTAETLCRQLMEIAPVYYVTGNHECVTGLINEAYSRLGELGVICLSNDYRLISRGEDSIVIAGVEDPNRWSVMEAPDEVIGRINADSPGSFIVLLGHRNDWPEKYPDLQVDIILSGHGHGGLIRLPLVGGIIGTDRALFPEYDAGVFESGEYTMIVSRGLGNSAAPRFLNNPDIVLIELKK